MEQIFLKRNEATEFTMRKMAEDVLDKGLTHHIAHT